jgi:hypothetical protein
LDGSFQSIKCLFRKYFENIFRFPKFFYSYESESLARASDSLFLFFRSNFFCRDGVVWKEYFFRRAEFETRTKSDEIAARCFDFVAGDKHEIGKGHHRFELFFSNGEIAAMSRFFA